MTPTPRRATPARPAAPGGQLTRGRRKRQEAIEAGDHERPYDTPLLGGTLPGRAGRDGRPAAAARGRRGRRGGQRGADVRPPVTGPGRPGPAAPGRPGTIRGSDPRPSPARPGRGPGRRPGRPGWPARPRRCWTRASRRAAHADRRQRRQLHAAARRAAAAGDGAEDPDPRQRPHGRGAVGGAGAVRGGCPGDRVHPGADRDQVRDRARPRRSRWSGSPRCRRTSRTR